MPAVIVSCLMLLVALFGGLATNAFSTATANRLDSLRLAQAVVARAVAQYETETGQAPASLAALVAYEPIVGRRPYKELISYLSTANGGLWPASRDRIFVSGTASLADGGLTYQRAAVAAQKDFTETQANYLSASRNACPPSSGSADFATTSSWCGAKNSFYSAPDTKQVYNKLFGTAVKRQGYLSDKIVKAYKISGTLPAAATATPLRNLVTTASGASVGTSLSTCTGGFALQGIPLECANLYNTFGNPVSYQKLAAKSFQLTSVSSFKDATGASITIATQTIIP